MHLSQKDIEGMADEYEAAPHGIPAEIEHLCHSFAAWSRQRAAAIAKLIHVERTTDEVPYKSAGDLFVGYDVSHTFMTPEKFFEVPAYDVETNIALRICHDVDGHLSSRAGFSYEDECLAFATQALVTPLIFIPLIFSDIIQQVSYTVCRRQFPTVQKPFLTERQDIVAGVAQAPFITVEGVKPGHLVRCPEPGCFSISGECSTHDSCEVSRGRSAP